MVSILVQKSILVLVVFCSKSIRIVFSCFLPLSILLTTTVLLSVSYYC
nr:MAG TPA: hypothetical protein [Caudoviricetes sp.]